MKELEHIKPILFRVLRAVMASWEEQGKREEIETKSQGEINENAIFRNLRQ